VAADAPVAAPLEKGEYNFTQVVYYLYVGPYDKVEYAYGKIASFIDQKGYKAAGPSIERYLDAIPIPKNWVMSPEFLTPRDRLFFSFSIDLL